MNNETVSIKGKEGNITAYVAYPAAKKAPAIIVIHEIWGLNENIKDIANRFAAEGFLAIAPELLAGSGVEGQMSMDLLREAADPATRDEAQKKMREALAPIRTPEFAGAMMKKLDSLFKFSKDHPRCDGTVGVAGFCFGGTYSFALAVEEPQLAFAVSFYGQPPQPFEKIVSISCPVLAFYGEKDANLMNTLSELEAAMKKYKKDFRAIVYPNIGHAFFNDKNPMMYGAEAAGKAWEEVKAFIAPYK